MKRFPLHLQILLAIVLAVGCGLAIHAYESGGRVAGLGPVGAVGAFGFIGDLFLRALKMLVVPLVVSSIITGVAGIGSVEGFGRLGLKTLGYYALTSLLSILVGLSAVNLIRPGSGGTHTAATSELSVEVKTALAKTEGRGLGDVVGVVQRLIPDNVFKSAAEGDMLGLIFFSLIFGFFITQLAPVRQEQMLGFFQGVNDVMLMITDLVMKFAPIGVFALVGKVVATTGTEAFAQVAWFFVTVMLGLAVHMFVVLPLMMKLIGRVSPLRHYRAMMPALLTAFSTASSSATLPVTMECVNQRAGVSKRVTGFTLPLGATVNMDGTALYECVAVLFIAQSYGIAMSFTAQFTVVLLALLTSVGVAGIPAASLVAIVIIMNAVGVPAEGIGLILAVDRILDMCRTAVNIFSDSCAAVLIGRSEGETEILTQ